MMEKGTWYAQNEEGTITSLKDDETGQVLAYRQPEKGCLRCEGEHEQLEYRPLNNALDQFNFFALCPTTGQPILLGFAGTGGEYFDCWVCKGTGKVRRTSYVTDEAAKA